MMTLRRLVAAVVVSWLALMNQPILWAEPDDEPAAEAKTKPAKVTPGQSGPDREKAEQAKAFRAVQRSALGMMKSKKLEQRAEAFTKLKEFPILDCAKLLVQQGMASPYEDVRKDAYATLASFRDSDEVCKFLLASVEKDSAKGMPSETTCALFAVPLSSDDKDIEEKAFQLFDKAAKRPKGGMLLLVTLADQLGATGDDASIATLFRISKRPVFKEHFGVRRSVVQALNKIEEKSAVDALVAILANVEGEVRGDIVQRLTSISGEKLGFDPPAWERWWKANRETFRFAAAGGRVVNRADVLVSKSLYYGLPIYAARLVFVIDTSGSMRGPRIEAAKRELTNAINALPEGVYFNVLAFDRNVRPWQRALTVASAENKKQAAAWVLFQGLGGATHSYDALEAAIDFDTEAVYFLTDGAPSGGKVVGPVDIVEVMSRLNFTRRITINAIGIGVGQPLPINPFYVFLTTLAERNYGEYKAVND
ncbi:MAG TPA: VWA domain-containing protein [Pirellulales bacterium]|nr:VWA domain-containing protein [Pirellulales bacterium]